MGLLRSRVNNNEVKSARPTTSLMAPTDFSSLLTEKWNAFTPSEGYLQNARALVSRCTRAGDICPIQTGSLSPEASHFEWVDS